MGIQRLNSYLLSHCSKNAIRQVHLSHLRNTKVSVDISIYLYKFYDNLVANLFKMLTIFAHYNITPIFVFDGKPTEQKNEVLKERKIQREKCRVLYEELITDETSAPDETERVRLQSIRLKHEDFVVAKNMIDSFANTQQTCSWIEAAGEADSLCASQNASKQVDACMSDDMDLFVYGNGAPDCSQIWRNFDLNAHTVIVYDTAQILRELGIEFNMFQNACILSGTDYNKGNKDKNVYYYLARGEDASEWTTEWNSTCKDIKRLFMSSGETCVNLKCVHKQISQNSLRTMLMQNGIVLASTAINVVANDTEETNEWHRGYQISH